MNLHEYQTKAIFSRYHIPTPLGRIALTAKDARYFAEELGGKVVIKAQTLASGRGKAGGVRLAKSPEEAETIANHILGLEINGVKVQKILVDTAINIQREMYLAIITDMKEFQPRLLASSEGGIEFEKIALNAQEKIHSIYIDPTIGLRDFQVREIALNLDLPYQYWKDFLNICQSLWHAYSENDAYSIEISPLVITTDHTFMALDGKITIDDRALFRHPDFIENRDLEGELPNEINARKYDLSCVKMDGSIGCLVNGTGLALAIMDLIHHFGGKPAIILDIGTFFDVTKVVHAYQMIQNDPNVKAVLINISGGNIFHDETAIALKQAIVNHENHPPVIFRLIGSHASTAVRILLAEQWLTAGTLEEAALKAVSAVKGESFS